MDIREIQRLHAQFAPDSMVIDLPRQIAALPGPADLSQLESARAMGGRFKALAPRARVAAIALAVAGMVGMAGMGAASLYTNVKARHDTASATSTAAPAPGVASRKGDELSSAAGKPEVPAYREVDATPAHPVSASPALSASDFASVRSLGLTADQFRDSLKAPARSAQATTPGAAPALTGEAQLAAVSPIHRAGPSREAAAQQPATPVQAAPAQPVFVTKPVAPVQSAPQSAQAAQTPVAAAQVPAPVTQAAQQAPAAQQPAEAVKPAHAARHHISRPRAQQSAEPNSDARPPAESRAGSAEVKMF